MPAVFVRLSGCNLRCHFCDTEFESGTPMSVEEVCQQVEAAGAHLETDLVVLTGGEPLRQQVIPLLLALSDGGWTTQIETAGTVWPPDLEREDGAGFDTLEALVVSGEVELVCSPKTPHVHDKIEQLCTHFKYIIRKGETDELDGLPTMSTQLAGKQARLSRLYRPHPGNAFAKVWVQPCEEYDAPGKSSVTRSMLNTTECARLAMKHGYRLSLQLHKILGLE